MIKDGNDNINIWNRKCELYWGRIEHFHIERGKTEKLNKDGSFKGWDPYDEYDEYNADQTEYYEFYGDNYTLQDIFPEQLLINDEKNQRLENADIEISLTKSTNRD